MAPMRRVLDIAYRSLLIQLHTSEVGTLIGLRIAYVCRGIRLGTKQRCMQCARTAWKHIIELPMKRLDDTRI
jgi:hypothetical protein